jgi:hypothetical protein
MSTSQNLPNKSAILTGTDKRYYDIVTGYGVLRNQWFQSGKAKPLRNIGHDARRISQSGRPEKPSKKSPATHLDSQLKSLFAEYARCHPLAKRGGR